MDKDQYSQLINEVSAAAGYAADAASSSETIADKLDEIIKLLKSIRRGQ